MKKVLLAFLFSFIAVQAYADTGPYIEGNLGYSYITNTVTDGIPTQDSQNFGFNLSTGVMFFNFGADLGYSQYGAPIYEGKLTQETAYLNGIHLAFKTKQSIGPLFIVGKLGYGWLNEGGFEIGNVSVPSRSGGGLYWAFGTGVQFNPNVYAQVTYEQNQGDNGIPNANMAMIGMGYTF
jgi:hypothetical protein